MFPYSARLLEGADTRAGDLPTDCDWPAGEPEEMSYSLGSRLSFPSQSPWVWVEGQSNGAPDETGKRGRRETAQDRRREVRAQG